MKKTNNPYNKKSKGFKMPTRKQWKRILCIAGVLALLVGVICISRIPLAQNNDPHAGHNHAPGESCTDTTTDPHAGHNHAPGESCTETPTHSHTAEKTYRVYTNSDGTYRLTVMGEDNKVVFEKDGLTYHPIEEKHGDDLRSLSWATGTGANEFEYVFHNTKTDQVSAVFPGMRATDGVRVCYSNADEDGMIVQDIFDKEVYYREYDLPDVYVGNGNAIVAGKLMEDGNNVFITYVGGEDGRQAKAYIPLYEDGKAE